MVLAKEMISQLYKHFLASCKLALPVCQRFGIELLPLQTAQPNGSLPPAKRSASSEARC